MRFSIIAIIALICLTTSPAAQVKLGFSAYAGGGVDFPMDDLNTYWKNGYHGSLGIGYRLSPGLEAVGRYGYHSMPSDTNETVDEFFADSKQDIEIHEYAVDLKANLAMPGMRFRPYGFISAGWAQMPDEGEFFYGIGGGIRVIALPRIDLFLEARYNRVTIDDYDVNYIPITMGVSVNL